MARAGMDAGKVVTGWLSFLVLLSKTITSS
jgi:hypothetical protein